MIRRGQSVPRLHVAEPPTSSRSLPPLTIDCSVIAAAFFVEPALEAQAWEAMRGCELHAPELLEYEFASVAVKKVATVGEAFARAALDSLDAIDLVLHSVDPKDCFELARRYRLTAHDAAYLWLAGELRAPLATFDRALAEAARQRFGDLHD